MSYFPLDRGILTSSLWANASHATIKVWIYLLLKADPRTGIVADADPAIALNCRLELDELASCLSELESPDPHSRSETKEGRRIERVKGRIRLINHAKFKKKDHSTERVRRFRDRRRNGKETPKRVSTVSETTEKETNTDKDLSPTERVGSTFSEYPPGVVWWNVSQRALDCEPVYAEWLDRTAYPEVHRNDLSAAWDKLSRWLEQNADRRESLMRRNQLKHWLEQRLAEDFKATGAADG